MPYLVLSVGAEWEVEWLLETEWLEDTLLLWEVLMGPAEVLLALPAAELLE